MTQDEIAILKLLVDNKVGIGAEGGIGGWDSVDLVGVGKRINKTIREVDNLLKNIKSLGYLEVYDSFIDVPNAKKIKKDEEALLKVSKKGITFVRNLSN